MPENLVMPQSGLALPGGFKPVSIVKPMIPPMVDEKAEREKAFAEIGDYLDQFEIAYNDILVLKYIPEKLGTLVAAKQTQLEQRYQSKCGLVLKFGPKAQVDGFLYEIGDWVYYRPSDGQEIGLKCQNSTNIALCLIMSPAHIIGRLANPDLIW